MRTTPRSLYPASGAVGSSPASDGRMPPAGLLLTAVWFGLAAGLGEAFVMAVRLFVRQEVIGDCLERVISPHVIWMAPLANLLLFTVIGLVVFAAARIIPRFVPLRPAVFVPAMLGFLSLQVICEGIHPAAWLLLAAGGAAETSRLIARRPQGFLRLAKRTVGWLALSAGGLIVGVYGWEATGERHEPAGVTTAKADAPNVLLIVLDTVRADSLSLHGYDRPTTPQLERLARGGVCFRWAMTPSPWTLPSHASMFTGRQPHETSVDRSTPLDATDPTLAEVLAGEGYRTAGFVANRYYCTREYGLGRGFVHYKDCFPSLDQVCTGSRVTEMIAQWCFGMIVGGRLLGQTPAADVNASFLKWLSTDDRRPFFAFLNYIECHDPYLPPETFRGKFAPRKPATPWPKKAQEISPEELRATQAAYDECLAYLDEEVGKLLGELRRRKLLENTLVIVTSDHGEHFGEHGLVNHGNSLYLPLLHVPLVVSWPGRLPAGRSVDEPVSLRDLPATVTDLIGLDGENGLEGASLAAYWDQTGGGGARPSTVVLAEVDRALDEPPHAPVSRGDVRSLFVGQYHYIRNGDGTEELYDFMHDSLEAHDLAGRQESRSTLRRCGTLLDEVLRPAAAVKSGRTEGRGSLPSDRSTPSKTSASELKSP